MARSEAGTFPRNPQDTQALLHNSHWLPREPGQNGLPSRHVAYYDAASLYPSSGWRFISSPFLFTPDTQSLYTGVIIKACLVRGVPPPFFFFFFFFCCAKKFVGLRNVSYCFQNLKTYRWERARCTFWRASPNKRIEAAVGHPNSLLPSCREESFDARRER